MIRVIIVGGDKPRSVDLHQGLLDSGLFVVEIQPRVTYSDITGQKNARDTSGAAYGRSLSASERCCALAHRLAQERILSTGGIILEDDAVVLDYPRLAHFSSKVVESKKSVLLNLSTTRCAEDVDWPLGRNSYVRTFGPTALAVGYAASSSAIRQLVGSNHSLTYLADWPPIGATHLRLKRPIVAHGHRNNVSLIESSDSREPVSIYTLISERSIMLTLKRIKDKFQFEFTRVILVLRNAEK